jgi:sacsin
LHALIDELHALSEGSCSPETTKKALVILEALLDTNLCEERTPILVPDVSNHLRPRSDLYYNDLGDRAYFIHLPDDCFMTHSKVDREFALRLKIRLLGLSELKPFNDDEDMCELLTNRISNVLLQYTVEQAFGELVSNAVDAGAKKFDVLLDEQTFGSSHILSPTLAVLHSLPALVIHNDATFTDRDFKGIRRIGKGGKDDRSDSIGQFGLGALSLYHFTEVSSMKHERCLWLRTFHRLS